MQELERKLQMTNYFMKVVDSLQIALDDNDTNVSKIRKMFALELSQYDHGLPMYARKKEFLALLGSGQCSVLKGGTGIGMHHTNIMFLLDNVMLQCV